MTDRFPGALATFVPELAPHRYGHTLAFSNDGKRLAATYSNYPEGEKATDILVQWDLARPATPVVASRITIGPTEGRALAYAPDGSLLSGGYGNVLVYPPRIRRRRSPSSGT